MCMGAFYFKNKFLQVSCFLLGGLFWFWVFFLLCVCCLVLVGLIVLGFFFVWLFFDKWKECKGTSE